MNREIKFRALDENGVWWYFTLTDLVRGDTPATTGVLKNWCQFTGLHDKAGREIYEGDILQWPKPEQTKGSVLWDDSMCSWMVQRGDYSETFSSFAYPRQSNGLCRFEIIGDIYQNLELLK